MNNYIYFVVGSILFGVVTSIIGFLAGVWFNWRTPDIAQPATCIKSDASGVETEIRRALAASATLASLAESMSSDVNAHTIKIESISVELSVPPTPGEETAIAYEDFPKRILEANSELQQQLAKAKEHIARQAAQLRLRESEALTDSLTGLSNRRAFEDDIRKQLAGWERKATPFNLLMLDIDHFKRFNDAHGHQTGDAVLSEVAHVITIQLRDMDTAYRYGGEEFAVLLPSTATCDAGIVAERIRKAIEQAIVRRENKALKVTMSIGFANVISGDKVAETIRRADEALYKSKSAGRNCIHLHNGREVLPLGLVNNPGATVEKGYPVDKAESRAVQAAFNRELTKSVCDSRRDDIPVTLVAVQTSAPALNEANKRGRAISIELAMTLIESNLRKDQRLLRVRKNGLLILFPGKQPSDAHEFMQDLNLDDAEFAYETFKLLPTETAEQFLLRASATVTVQEVLRGTQSVTTTNLSECH